MRQPVLELIDDVGVADKGERVVVDAHVHAELDVQPVALRDGRQVCALPADVQVPPASRPLSAHALGKTCLAAGPRGAGFWSLQQLVMHTNVMPP